MRSHQKNKNSGVATLSNGNGLAEKTIASTISAIFTIPITRLISTSFDFNGPSRNAAAKLPPTPSPRSIASSGATDNAQLTTAQSKNSASVPTITSEKYPTRFGSPPLASGPVTVTSAARSLPQNQTIKLPSRA